MEMRKIMTTKEIKESKCPIVRTVFSDMFKDEDYIFEDPVLGTCNLSKAMRDRNEAIRREYEEYFKMHTVDGAFVKSKRHRSL